MKNLVDERVEEALEFSQYRVTVKNKLENLKRKLHSDLIYAKNGGIFHINQTLINFVELLVRQKKEQIFLLDSNQTPIKISDPDNFFGQIIFKYSNAMNEYFMKYHDVVKLRTVRKVVDLK